MMHARTRRRAPEAMVEACAESRNLETDRMACQQAGLSQAIRYPIYEVPKWTVDISAF